MPDDPISIAAAARAIGVNKSTLARQLKGSDVEFIEGKVRLSDVLAFRANAIDLTRSGRRAGRADALDTPLADATIPVADATRSAADATAEAEDGEPVLVDGQTLSYRDARALKETYLARLRKHEFEIAMGEWVRVEEVGCQVEREYGTIRNGVLGLPSKVADRGAMQPRDVLHKLLQDAVEDLLLNLSNPDEIAGKASREG